MAFEIDIIARMHELELEVSRMQSDMTTMQREVEATAEGDSLLPERIIRDVTAGAGVDVLRYDDVVTISANSAEPIEFPFQIHPDPTDTTKVRVRAGTIVRNGADVALTLTAGDYALLTLTGTSTTNNIWIRLNSSSKDPSLIPSDITAHIANSTTGWFDSSNFQEESTDQDANAYDSNRYIKIGTVGVDASGNLIVGDIVQYKAYWDDAQHIVPDAQHDTALTDTSEEPRYTLEFNPDASSEHEGELQLYDVDVVDAAGSEYGIPTYDPVVIDTAGDGLNKLIYPIMDSDVGGLDASAQQSLQARDATGDLGRFVFQLQDFHVGPSGYDTPTADEDGIVVRVENSSQPYIDYLLFDDLYDRIEDRIADGTIETVKSHHGLVSFPAYPGEVAGSGWNQYDNHGEGSGGSGTGAISGSGNFPLIVLGLYTDKATSWDRNSKLTEDNYIGNNLWVETDCYATEFALHDGSSASATNTWDAADFLVDSSNSISMESGTGDITIDSGIDLNIITGTDMDLTIGGNYGSMVTGTFSVTSTDSLNLTSNRSTGTSDLSIQVASGGLDVDASYYDLTISMDHTFAGNTYTAVNDALTDGVYQGHITDLDLLFATDEAEDAWMDYELLYG